MCKHCRRTYAILHNVKFERGKIEYHRQPDSTERVPDKLPLTFYKLEPRATIGVVQPRIGSNDTAVPLRCAGAA